jgi:hypothetical protein
MASESGEWCSSAPVRTLLWWPLIAFVLVVVFPDVGPVGIAAAGLVLAGAGALIAAVSRPRSAPSEVSVAAGGDVPAC